MATNQRPRLRPALLQADKDALAALQAIPGYQPMNPAYAVAELESALSAHTQAQAAEVQAQAAYAAARDTAGATERRFHDLMVGMKEQVIAQFGSNSNEVAAIGLKKKSEYKRPLRKAPKPKEL